MDTYNDNNASVFETRESVEEITSEEQAVFEAAVFSGVYNSADPNGLNPYLACLLAPFRSPGTVVPSLDLSPSMTKCQKINVSLSWINSNSTVMLIWTPRSAGVLAKIFINDGSVWSFLSNINSDQPLNLNFREYRLVAAGFKVNSASQAAGVFTLAGTANAIHSLSIPPFTGLNFNNMVSYAENISGMVEQVSVQDGVATIWRPDGDDSWMVPETTVVHNVSHPIKSYSYANGPGWIPTGSSLPIGTTIIFDTDNAPGFLPDPLWGWTKLKGTFQLTATTGYYTLVAYQVTRSANAGTWTSFLTTAPITTSSYQGINNSPITFDFETPDVQTDSLITRFYVQITMTVAAAGFDLVGTRGFVELTAYDYYCPGKVQPCHMIMMERVNAGQPVSFSGVMHYELKPNPNLSRNVDVYSPKLDIVYKEMARDYFASGRVPVIFSNTSYMMHVDRMLEKLASNIDSYESASPSLKSKLYSLWKRFRPGVKAMLNAGGRAAVMAGAAALNPALLPAAGYMSNMVFDSAEPEEPTQQTIQQEVVIYESADFEGDEILEGLGDGPLYGRFTLRPQAVKVTAIPKTKTLKDFRVSYRSDFTVADFMDNSVAKRGVWPRFSLFPILKPVSLSESVAAEAELAGVVVTNVPIATDSRSLVFRSSTLPSRSVVLVVDTSKIQFRDDGADEEYFKGLANFLSVSAISQLPEETFYITYDSSNPFRGSSYQMATLAAFVGSGATAVLSGGVTWDDREGSPRFRAPGRIAEKAAFVLPFGKTFLVGGDSMEDPEITFSASVYVMRKPGAFLVNTTNLNDMLSVLLVSGFAKISFPSAVNRATKSAILNPYMPLIVPTAGVKVRMTSDEYEGVLQRLLSLEKIYQGLMQVKKGKEPHPALVSRIKKVAMYIDLASKVSGTTAIESLLTGLHNLEEESSKRDWIQGIIDFGVKKEAAPAVSKQLPFVTRSAIAVPYNTYIPPPSTKPPRPKKTPAQTAPAVVPPQPPLPVRLSQRPPQHIQPAHSYFPPPYPYYPGYGPPHPYPPGVAPPPGYPPGGDAGYTPAPQKYQETDFSSYY
jgi:hypothetical protein